MQICRRDILPALVALKSFFCHSMLQSSVGITFHCDRSVGKPDVRRLVEHFPGAQIILHRQAAEKVGALLRYRPLCRDLFNKFLFGLKLFQIPVTARANWVLLLDSDVIFRAKPIRIVESILNGDRASLWLDERPNSIPDKGLTDALCQVCQHLRINEASLIERWHSFNAGLLLFSPLTMDFDLVEDYLGWSGAEHSIHVGGWVREQTAYKLNFARWNNTERLSPAEYACGTRPATVFNHYFSANYWTAKVLNSIRGEIRRLPATTND